MKSLNIKIPLTIAQAMDSNAHLNPSYITSFIVLYHNRVDSILDKPITELSYNYTFKVPADLHRVVKILSVERDIPMNDLVGRLLAVHYPGVRHE